MPRRLTLPFALGLAALAFAPGCAPRRSLMPPASPPQLQYSPDARTIDVLERCDATLRAAAATATAAASPSPRVDALSALSRQRLLLVMSLTETRKQATALDARVLRARQSLRAQAQSELERALIAEALIDLDEGRQPTRPLSKRLAAREEFRDSVEAHALLRETRDKLARIEAQIDALDSTFAQITGGEPAPALVPVGLPAGRPIDPRL